MSTCNAPEIRDKSHAFLRNFVIFTTFSEHTFLKSLPKSAIFAIKNGIRLEPVS
jgi:hypothetical protein